MAGEKTTAKPKVEEVEELKQEQTITMTADEFQKMISNAVAAGANAGAKTPAPGINRQVQDENSKLANTLTRKINERMLEGNKFYALLANSKQRTRVSIPQIYQEHVGKHLTVTINGSTVKVPVDGNYYYMHPAHAAIVNEKLRYISENVARNKRNNDMFGTEAGDFEKVG